MDVVLLVVEQKMQLNNKKNMIIYGFKQILLYNYDHCNYYSTYFKCKKGLHISTFFYFLGFDSISLMLYYKRYG